MPQYSFTISSSSIRLVLAFFAMNLVISAGDHPAKRKMTLEEKAMIIKDQAVELSGISPRLFSPETRTRSGRDVGLTSVLVDSSKNGYGAYLETPNPLAYSIDNGWVAVYRQWGGFDATAGYIGVAQSEDGEEWFVEPRINTVYPEGVEEPDLPTATGTPQGRYPSAAVSSTHNKATAIWNEYTNSSNGGGTYGGRPMYAYDFFGLGMNTNFSSPYNLNNGCATFPCDPPDLWNGNIQMVDGDDGATRLFAAYNSWAGGTENWMIRSLNITNGYITPADPYIFTDYSNEMDNDGDCLWYECSGYTGDADFHINNDGVGYMANTSWTANSGFEEPNLHTIFFKKTEDHGQTWTSDEGYMNSGYYYLSDAEMIRLSDSLYTLWSNNPDMYPDMPWYPWAECTDEYGYTYTCGDTITYDDSGDNFFWTPGWFLHYTYDMITDQDGGFHFVVPNYPFVCLDVDGGCEDSDGDGLADSIYWENRMGGAGMMHFYNPDPIETPDSWTATLIQDFSDTYYADWAASDIPTLNDPIYYFYPQISPSYEEGSGVLWYGAFNMSAGTYDADEVSYLPSDIDLYIARSTDNGSTWSEPENVTNTPGGIFPDKQLEVGVHLANVGSDTEIGVFYQMPEFTVETFPPAVGYEDYMNRVYVGVYSTESSTGEDCDLNDVLIACDGGGWQSEVYWELFSDANGEMVSMGGAPFYQDDCIDDGDYTLYMWDSYGDGWNGNWWQLYDNTTEEILAEVSLESGEQGEYSFSIGTTTVEYDNVVTIDSVSGLPGDTVMVGVHIDIDSTFSLNSYEMTFSGFDDSPVEFVGIDTSGSLTGQLGWMIYFNAQDSVEVAAAGGIEMTGQGTLLGLVFAIGPDASETEIPVHATDVLLNEDATASEIVSGSITVLMNSSPILVNPVPDIVVDEDSEQLTFSLIGSEEEPYFYDPDIAEGDQLSYTAYDAVGGLIVAQIEPDPVSGDETVYLDFMPDANGVDTLFVTATDQGGLFAIDTILVTVNPVNDAPGSFTLVSPPDNSEIVITEMDIAQNAVVDVVWESSPNVDDDEISYGFVLYAGPYTAETPTFVDTLVTDTMLAIPYAAVLAVMTLAEESYISCDWTVYATDGVDTTSASDVWTVTLDARGILDIDDALVPDKFALHQNYPNPFNPITNIRYDLPENSFVTLVIYDIKGGEVCTLINDQLQESGYRNIVWNGRDQYGRPRPSGMYIYTMRASDFNMTRKMIMLK